MRADERVTGLPSMVEPPMRPGASVVTTGAFRLCAEMALVIVLVAARAGHRQFESGRILGRVTAFTFQPLVRAGEGITGLARVIELPFVPCERIVAIPALCIYTEAAQVIAVAMAFLAGERRVFIAG